MLCETEVCLLKFNLKFQKYWTVPSILKIRILCHVILEKQVGNSSISISTNSHNSVNPWHGITLLAGERRGKYLHKINTHWWSDKSQDTDIPLSVSAMHLVCPPVWDGACKTIHLANVTYVFTTRGEVFMPWRHAETKSTGEPQKQAGIVLGSSGHAAMRRQSRQGQCPGIFPRTCRSRTQLSASTDSDEYLMTPLVS